MNVSGYCCNELFYHLWCKKNNIMQVGYFHKHQDLELISTPPAPTFSNIQVEQFHSSRLLERGQK